MEHSSFPNFLGAEYPPGNFLNVEYPISIATGEHDMEFYMGGENTKRTQLCSAMVPDITQLGAKGEATQQPINLSTINQQRGLEAVRVTEATLFDEFISLVDGSHVSQTKTESTDLRASYKSYNNTSTQDRPHQGEQENISPMKSKRVKRIFQSSESSNVNSNVNTYSSSSMQKQKNKKASGQHREAGESSLLRHREGGKSSLPRHWEAGERHREASESSLLRQQLQGTLCSTQYSRSQEPGPPTYNCTVCNNVLSAKCILGTCMKSEEVLCPQCRQELTAKCLLSMCKRQPRSSSF